MGASERGREPLYLCVRPPQLLLASPSPRDVAADAARLGHAPGGVTLNDAGVVLEPLLPVVRVQVAILEGDALHLPVAKLLAQFHHALLVMPQGMHIHEGGEEEHHYYVCHENWAARVDEQLECPGCLLHPEGRTDNGVP